MSFYDIAIIGGGPAGLTAASVVARQLHTAVVFDSKTYRNAQAAHMHMVPGWDHQSPADFREKARADIVANYSTVQFVDVPVEKIEKKSKSHFQILDGEGHEWSFRKVLLAVGCSDIYPDIEGYGELWTKRIFHCLFCHGYEERGAPSSGVLAIYPKELPTDMVAPLAVHSAHNAAQLTERVTIYTHGDEELTARLRPSAAAHGKFELEPRAIRRLAYAEEEEEAPADAVTVHLADGGGQRRERFLAHTPAARPQGPFVAQLAIPTTGLGDIRADPPAYETGVPGVFAAGDCVSPYKVIPGALSSACNAAVAACGQLQAEKYEAGPAASGASASASPTEGHGSSKDGKGRLGKSVDNFETLF